MLIKDTLDLKYDESSVLEDYFYQRFTKLNSYLLFFQAAQRFVRQGSFEFDAYIAFIFFDLVQGDVR